MFHLAQSLLLHLRESFLQFPFPSRLLVHQLNQQRGEMVTLLRETVLRQHTEVTGVNGGHLGHTEVTGSYRCDRDHTEVTGGTPRSHGSRSSRAKPITGSRGHSGGIGLRWVQGPGRSHKGRDRKHS